MTHYSSEICALQPQSIPLSYSAIMQALQFLQLPLQVRSFPHSHSSTPVEQLTLKSAYNCTVQLAEDIPAAQLRCIFYLIAN